MSTQKQQLDEAKKALHDLVTGQSAVTVQKNGRQVQFKPADEVKLRAYIRELEAGLGVGSGRRRPARFFG